MMAGSNGRDSSVVGSLQGGRHRLLAALCLGLLVFGGAAWPWRPAAADCRPDGVFKDGDTITCTGVDTNGWPSEDPPDGTPEEDIPTPPIDNLTVIIEPGATVSGSADPSNPITIDLYGSFETVFNNGTISTSGFEAESVGILGIGARVANTGVIDTAGTGAEGIGIEGSSAVVTNSGIMTVNGVEAEAIGIEGSGARVTNSGSIGLVGDATGGIGVEGANARITNSGGITTDGTGTAGIGVEGAGARIENSGSVTTLGTGSAAIGAFGDSHVIENTGRATVGIGSIALGGIGAGGTITNSGVVDANGSDSAGILAFGAGQTVTNAAGGTVVVNGSDGVGISLGFTTEPLASAAATFGVLLPDSSGSVTNDGTITVNGERARGVAALGDDITITNNRTIDTSAGGAGVDVEGNDNKVINVVGATITGGGIVANGENVEIINGGEVGAAGTGAHAIEFNGTGAMVTNTLAGKLKAEADMGYGIVGGGTGAAVDDATVRNDGKIIVGDTTSTGARGIDLTGDRVRVRNGTDVPSDKANITVNGAEGVGIAVEGINAVVSNQAAIVIDGQNARAIEVTVGAADGFRVENSAGLAVKGTGARGLVVKGGAIGAGTATVTVAKEFTGCNPDPGNRSVVNCGGMTLSGDQTRGIAVEAVRNGNIENQQAIIGAGREVIGMSVTGGSSGPLAASEGNIVTNFDKIVLAGELATGLFVRGRDNTVLHGSGTTLFPDGLLINSFLDFVTNDDPAGTGPRKGEIEVTGIGAVGIAVEGERNRIGLREFSQVVADGAGGAAVAMSGDVNLLVNDGVIVGRGGAVAVRGSSGRERVLNDGVINGAINLLGGDDELALTDRTVQLGVADGGAGRDAITVVVPLPGIKDPLGATLVIDGDEFVNFEELTKLSAGELRIENALNLDTVSVEQGKLALKAGSVLRATTSVALEKGPVDPNLPPAFSPATRLEVRAGSELRTPSLDMAAGTEACIAGTFTGVVQNNGGAKLEAGCSIGTATIIGDLESAGLLEIEIGGLGAGEFDVFDIFGTANFLGGEILFSFLDGFLPELGDNFDFLAADNILGLESVDFAFTGLADGFDFDIGLLDGSLRLTTMAVAGGPGGDNVPEPATWLLFAFAVASFGAMSARRKPAPSRP